MTIQDDAVWRRRHAEVVSVINDQGASEVVVVRRVVAPDVPAHDGVQLEPRRDLLAQILEIHDRRDLAQFVDEMLELRRDDETLRGINARDLRSLARGEQALRAALQSLSVVRLTDQVLIVPSAGRRREGETLQCWPESSYEP